MCSIAWRNCSIRATGDGLRACCTLRIRWLDYRRTDLPLAIRRCATRVEAATSRCGTIDSLGRVEWRGLLTWLTAGMGAALSVFSAAYNSACNLVRGRLRDGRTRDHHTKSHFGRPARRLSTQSQPMATATHGAIT